MRDADAGEMHERAPTEQIHGRRHPEPEDAPARRLSSLRVILWSASVLLVAGFIAGVAVATLKPRAKEYIEARAQAAVAEHAAQPGHAADLAEHEKEQREIQDLRGDVREVKGTVDTILQLIQNGAGRRR